MEAKEKAKELQAQFGDNAKYVVLEVLDDLKEIRYLNSSTIFERIEFWQEVKQEIINL